MRQETKIYLLIGLVFVLSVAMVISDSLTEKKAGAPARLTSTAPMAQERLTHMPIQPEVGQTDVPGQIPPMGNVPGNQDGGIVIDSDPIPAPGIGTGTGTGIETGAGTEEGNIATNFPTQEEEARVTKPVIHYVKDKETLWDIAAKYYGKGYLWKKIQKANPKVVSAKGVVRAGMRLEIPHKDAVIKTNTVSPQVTTNDRGTRTTQPTGGAQYTVADGDSLWKIAAKKLGSGTRSNEILKLNKDVLGSQGNRLKIGMVLKMPTR